MKHGSDVDEVTTPVVVIEIDRYTSESYFILPTSHSWMRLPGAKISSRNVRRGPSMVVVERRNETTRTKRYDLSDPKLWQRIGPLMQVGFFALNSRVLAPHLPDDLLRHSKRFGDLSQERRKRLAAKLPKGEHAGKQRR